MNELNLVTQKFCSVVSNYSTIPYKNYLYLQNFSLITSEKHPNKPDMQDLLEYTQELQMQFQMLSRVKKTLSQVNT